MIWAVRLQREIGTALLCPATLTAMLFAGCAAPKPEPPAVPPPPPPSRPAEPVREPAAHRFEQLQLERAQQSAKGGRLADSALAWETLTLLRPKNDFYRRQLAQSRQVIEREVDLCLARAASARTRGDAVGAERAWLEALSLDPRNDTASQALRDLERDRSRISFAGRFAVPLAPVARNGGQPQAAASGLSASRNTERNSSLPGRQNAIEHASLLAGQGEFDAAIGLLTEQYSTMPTDPHVRRLLAGLYFQRGERQAARDTSAATADLERALALNPGLEQARTRLRQLKPVRR